VALPAWLARTVHVPALSKVMVAPFVPPEVHIEGVDVLKVTVNPDEAVALTVTGDCARVMLAEPRWGQKPERDLQVQRGSPVSDKDRAW
jgi:hypothetical protein